MSVSARPEIEVTTVANAVGMVGSTVAETRDFPFKLNVWKLVASALATVAAGAVAWINILLGLASTALNPCVPSQLVSASRSCCVGP
jgi:hypothetical protein